MNDSRVYYSHDAEVQAARDKAMLTLVCLALGLGIGAVMALMFAPNSGEKTRKELGHALEEGVNTGRGNVEPTLKRLEKEFSELRQKVDEKVTNLR